MKQTAGSSFLASLGSGKNFESKYYLSATDFKFENSALANIIGAPLGASVGRALSANSQRREFASYDLVIA